MPTTPDDPSNGVLIRRLLALSWQYRRQCLTALTLGAGTLLLELTALGLVGLGIDMIQYHADSGITPISGWLGAQLINEWSPMAAVTIISAAVIGAATLYALLWYGAMISEARLVQDIIVRLRSEVYDKLQRLSFRFFDSHESGSIINRVTADVQAVRGFVDRVIIEGLGLLLALLFYLIYMLNIHAALTLACLATTPLIWVGVVTFTRIVRPAYKRSRTLADDMVLRLSESVQGIHVVKGFARQESEISKFQQASLAVRDQQQWIFWRVSTFVPAITFLTHLNHIVLLGYGGYLVIQDQLPLGSGLIVFAGILQRLSTRVSDISNIANSVQRSLTGAARVFEVLDTPIEIASTTQTKPLPNGMLGVRLDNVEFGYKEDQPVLHSVNLEVQPGQCIALLGATGSGKSTLLSLIPRFYDVTDGQVYVGGVDVRELDLDELRRSIGTVFQENFLFSNTVAANIAFGHPEVDRKQIKHAARIAAIHDFITQLPDGYDTIIGENGVDLSGGQRQRLAIARAVLLNPSIMLLDDPTAGVDPQTEHQILTAMDQAIAGRTTIVITNRLSTLRWADRIAVIDRGRIVQVGSHDQLMAASNWYREMAQLQGAQANATVTPAGTKGSDYE